MTEQMRAKLWSALSFASSRSAISAADKNAILDTWDSFASLPRMSEGEIQKMFTSAISEWTHPNMTCGEAAELATRALIARFPQILKTGE